MEYKKEIDYGMALQDLKDLSLIQLLQRAREREDLTAETARKLDEIEKRVENGEPIPDEEMEFFAKAVFGTGINNGRLTILREKAEAYYKEQKSVQDVRILTAEQREEYAYAEKSLAEQLSIAAQQGNIERIETLQKSLESIQKARGILQEPQKIERRPVISEEEREQVYQNLEGYEEKLTEEVNEYFKSIEDLEEKSEETDAGNESSDDSGTVSNSKEPFGLDDLKNTTSEVKRSDVVQAYTQIKRDKEKDKEKGKDKEEQEIS